MIGHVVAVGVLAGGFRKRLAMVSRQFVHVGLEERDLGPHLCLRVQYADERIEDGAKEADHGLTGAVGDGGTAMALPASSAATVVGLDT